MNPGSRTALAIASAPQIADRDDLIQKGIYSHVWLAIAFAIMFINPSFSLSAKDALANERAPISARDLRDFARANIFLEKRQRAFKREIFSSQARIRPDFPKKSADYQQCVVFAYIDLYARFSFLIDNIDTSPFVEEGDFRRDRYDDSILVDPKKIAVKIKEILSSLKYDKGYYAPLHDYAIKKSHDERLAALCHAYLRIR